MLSTRKLHPNTNYSTQMVQLGVIQNVKIQKGEDIYPIAWFQRTVMHRTIN